MRWQCWRFLARAHSTIPRAVEGRCDCEWSLRWRCCFFFFFCCWGFAGARVELRMVVLVAIWEAGKMRRRSASRSVSSSASNLMRSHVAGKWAVWVFTDISKMIQSSAGCCTESCSRRQGCIHRSRRVLPSWSTSLLPCQAYIISGVTANSLCGRRQPCRLATTRHSSHPAARESRRVGHFTSLLMTL